MLSLPQLNQSFPVPVIALFRVEYRAGLENLQQTKTRMRNRLGNAGGQSWDIAGKFAGNVSGVVGEGNSQSVNWLFNRPLGGGLGFGALSRGGAVLAGSKRITMVIVDNDGDVVVAA